MTAEVIDYATGEAIEPGELVPFQRPAAIERSAEGVVAVLTHARHWLASAVEMTGPADVAAVKATVAMAATYSRELQLSKEIQMDAQEMVRRAEYALGKSIRHGQQRGEIGDRASATASRIAHQTGDTSLVKPSPTTFATSDELSGNGGGIYAMADDVSAEEFEEAITEAKTEGNLSRANVVRKIKGQQSAMTRGDRAREIERLAGLGYSTRQIAPMVGIGERAVYDIQRDHQIEIPADRYVKRTRRIDTNRIISEAVSALEGIAMTLDLVNPADIDQEQARTWLNSLTESLQALSKAKRQIKESMR